MPLEVSVALIALGGVLVGAVLSILGQIASDAISARRAAKVREEQRNDALWQMSQPAAERLHELLGRTIDLATPELYPSMHPQPEFDDAFGELWYERKVTFRTDVALLPDAEYRSALLRVGAGIDDFIGLAKHTDYGESVSAQSDRSDRPEVVVRAVAQLAFDIVSAWRRGERPLGPDLIGCVEVLEGALAEMHDGYQREFGEQFY